MSGKSIVKITKKYYNYSKKLYDVEQHHKEKNVN